ncbi:PII-interacting protein PipX family protein [Candidatus Cyanaurora vandensis]|uniref:PII-interacting protein PipX family protein n=1 Tax=Candidatus Cyanaurora vandensis TaxID=2714958 RepID=UPI00257C5270|nr:PII-interacting protein PipX family protein [Candidatus Cyanaurora vandensis]
MRNHVSQKKEGDMGERYIHHPNFGLLYTICPAPEANKNLFTTLYAHRLFFLVTEKPGEPVSYEAMSRSEAKQLVDERIRQLKRLRDPELRDELERTVQFFDQPFA